ncbi:MAG: hypothetical protein IJH07_00960 [Ruminococcus sp.]|nr:hypothetical protein [Ruminococcus sp.]
MNELRIVRGTDVKLYVDQTPLFGVTAFSAVQKPLYHEVYEYLSAKPCERISQGTRYELTLSVMALFDKQLPSQSVFTLSVVDSDTTYYYEGCRVIKQKTAVKGSENAAEVFTLVADSMRRQVAESE